jgi:hypothetical protein
MTPNARHTTSPRPRPERPRRRDAPQDHPTRINVRLGLTQPRLNALLKGRIDQFSLDALVNVATRAGLHVALRVAKAPTRNAA